MKALAALAAALCLAGPAAAQSAKPVSASAPALTPAFTLKVLIGPGIEAGESGGGRKRIVPIAGGVVEGRLKGVVLPGGADWQIIRPDGVTEIWAKYNIQPETGPAIVVTTTGVRRASPEVAARIAAGELVDPSQYYFRAAPMFETGNKDYAWLTSSVFVCAGERKPDHVAFVCYEVG